MTSRTYGDRAVSPNQEFRRAEIVEAAVEVMRTAGVAGCTVRSVAERAGVSKGVVHYYFADAQELVELAFAGLARSYYAHVRAGAAALADPVAAMWHALVSYVTPWDTHSSMTLLWCEYYVAGVRAGRFAGVVAMQREMRALFADLLARVAPELATHADALTRYVTGAVLSQPQLPVDPADLVAEAARLIGLPAPAGPVAGCAEPGCRFHCPRRASTGRPSAAAE